MKTPQEKKLRYDKDRRNTYGQSSKGSRAAVPRHKAHDIRAERHAQDQSLAAATVAKGDDELPAVEAAVKSTPPRKWKKSPDTPLGKLRGPLAPRKPAGHT